MTGHVRSDYGREVCITCHPELGPDDLGAETPVSEGHWAARFRAGGGRASFLLDGADMSNVCIETVAGNPGWAELALLDDQGRYVLHIDAGCPGHGPYEGDPPRCDCHFATHVVTGSIAVRSRVTR